MQVIIARDFEDQQEPLVDPFIACGHPLANLLRALGYPDEALPLASLLAKQQKLGGQWALISPVHWQASHNDVQIVAAGSELLADYVEGQLFFQNLAEFFKPLEINLHPIDADLCLVERSLLPEFRDCALSSIKNRSLMPIMAELDSSLKLQRLLTELQMWLEGNPLNQQRQEEGRPTINGAWIWGNTAALKSQSPQRLLTTAKYYETASLVVAQVDLLKPELDLSHYDLILIDDLKQLSPQQKIQLSKKARRWHYNNLGWSVKPQSWWQRIRSVFSHADQAKKKP